MTILLWATNEYNEQGQITGLSIRYVTSNGVEASVFFTLEQISGKTAAEIRAMALAVTQADTAVAGIIEREDILPNNIKSLLTMAENEITYLETNIPLILGLTTVTQLRVAVDRLARENLAIIKVLMRIVKR